MKDRQKRLAGSTIASVLVLTTLSGAEALAKPRDVSHSTSVETRLSYLNNMLDSRSGQRLMLHEGGVTYREVLGLFKQAKSALQNNQPEKADRLAKRGFVFS